jgi:hypothetical protein
VITDRDIAIRALANGKSPDTPVKPRSPIDTIPTSRFFRSPGRHEQGSPDCFEYEDIEHVTKNVGSISKPGGAHSELRRVRVQRRRVRVPASSAAHKLYPFLRNPSQPIPG